MKKILTILLLTVTIGITAAFADSISVKVTYSKPIYETIDARIPHTHYEYVEENVPYACEGEYVNRNEIGLDTVVGSVLGVVIGNQVGHGNGRTAAKIVGGIGGGYVANKMRHGNTRTCYRKQVVRKKVTYYEYINSRHIVAYKNCGYIGNRYICKRTKRKKRYIFLNY